MPSNQSKVTFDYRRYPGAISFEDSEIYKRLFFGRERETYELLQTILFDTITILHAPSGYGKTSLLQAAVFPRLREHNYYPVVVRFNVPDKRPVVALLEKFSSIDREDEVKQIISTGDELVSFFENLSLNPNASNGHAKLVVVLDQFEELFTLEHNDEHRDQFLKGVSDLVLADRERLISIKIVISIREDLLARLESFGLLIPSIFSNRYALGALTRDGAAIAISKPAELIIPNVNITPPFSITPDAQKQILDFLCRRKSGIKYIETNEVSPIQLQIICAELEDVALSKQVSGKVIIEQADLHGENGLKSMLTSFYDKQIVKLKAKISKGEVRRLTDIVETSLIINGRRVPIAYKALISWEGVSQSGLDLLISNRLLKTEEYGSDNSLVEISHDTLVEPILTRRSREKLKKVKRYRQLAAGVIVLVILSLIGLDVYNANRVEPDLQLKNEEIDSLKKTVTKFSIGTDLIQSNANNDTLILNDRISDLNALITSKNAEILALRTINTDLTSNNELLKTSYAKFIDDYNKKVVDLTTLSNSGISITETLKVYNRAQQEALDSFLKTSEKIKITAKNVSPTATAAENRTYSSWFKEGFFLQFGDIKISLLKLNKQQSKITIRYCETESRGVCKAGDWKPKTLGVRDTIPFSISGYDYKLTLDRIGNEGYNILKPAADITLIRQKR